MTPLAIFLLAASAVFVGTVSAAFSAMMRLSLRLAAERGDRDDLLGWYLDDPMRLFIPARIVLAIIYVVAGALLARVIAMQAGHGLPTLIAAMAVFSLVCEHLVPLVLIRRDPEAVLGATLPLVPELHGILVSDDAADGSYASSTSTIAAFSKATEALDVFRALAESKELEPKSVKPWTDDTSDILGPFLSKMK
jgi:hypothetical protein